MRLWGRDVYRILVGKANLGTICNILESKNVIFWDVTSCDCCKNRRFAGTLRLHHQGDKNRWSRNIVRRNAACRVQEIYGIFTVGPRESVCTRSHLNHYTACFFLLPVLVYSSPWRWRQKVSPCARLNGVASLLISLQIFNSMLH
jgi:hypothetical protein